MTEPHYILLGCWLAVGANTVLSVWFARKIDRIFQAYFDSCEAERRMGERREDGESWKDGRGEN